MTNDVWVIEGPQVGRENEELAYTVTWTGAGTCATPLTKLYMNGTLSTSPLSGTESVAGIVQTLRVFTPPVGWGGKTAILEAECTVDGAKRIIGIEVKVLRRGARR